MKVKISTYHDGIIWRDIPKSDIFGDFAVTPALEKDNKGNVSVFGCDITHRPTGLSALPRWADGNAIAIANKEDARDLAKRFSQLPKDTINMGRLGDETAMATIKQMWRAWRFNHADG